MESPGWQRSLNMPIASVSLVDEDRQWFLSRIGVEAAETPRDVSFCAHAVFSGTPLIVPDAISDARFAGNPLVTGEPNVRAYAGAPVRTSEGFAIGTICVIDRKPRQFAPADLHALQDLANIIDEMIRVREFTLAYEDRWRKHRNRKQTSAV